MATIFGEIFGPTTGGGGGSGDTTPPTIAIVSPTPNTTPGTAGAFSADWQTARFTPIVIDITDAAPGIEYACVVVTYPGSTTETVVYRRGSFRGAFVGLSTSTVIANGLRLSILPLNGWPSSDALLDVTFDVDVIDGDGNLA